MRWKEKENFPDKGSYRRRASFFTSFASIGTRQEPLPPPCGPYCQQHLYPLSHRRMKPLSRNRSRSRALFAVRNAPPPISPANPTFLPMLTPTQPNGGQMKISPLRPAEVPVSPQSQFQHQSSSFPVLYVLPSRTRLGRLRLWYHRQNLQYRWLLLEAILSRRVEF